MQFLFEVLFQIFIGGLYHLCRALLYWLLDREGRTLRQAWDAASTETTHVWYRQKREERTSGQELLIRLAAGLLTAATLGGVGYLIYRWFPVADN